MAAKFELLDVGGREVKVTNPDSEPFEVAVNQTFNDEQISWFRHGSALNFMKWVNARATRSNVA